MMFTRQMDEGSLTGECLRQITVCLSAVMPACPQARGRQAHSLCEPVGREAEFAGQPLHVRVAHVRADLVQAPLLRVHVLEQLDALLAGLLRLRRPLRQCMEN